ncbi:MAG: HNH endonuclease [Paludibacter sp.]|nr:HNH endonuclease [Paludibacter sp.]
MIKDRIDDTQFRQVCKQSKSMAEAAATLNLHFNSFKKRALELGCYKPNQAGKGINKIAPKITLNDIVEKSLYPSYQSFKLKNRLINENVKNAVCEKCGLTEWNGKPIMLELHHIDGNRQNHLLKNLRLLCPNCHSQTDTYRAKNKKN